MEDRIIPNVIVYHTNDVERCDKFVYDHDYLIISEDVYWLGTGMYFWDNSSNAKYWLGEKNRKTLSECEFAIVKCNLLLDSLFDLTDNESIELLNKIVDLYGKKACCKIQNDQYGLKINFAIKLLEKLNNMQYTVLKAMGIYKTKNAFFRYSNNDRPHMDLSGKVIYLARKPEVAVNRSCYKKVVS